MLRGRAGCCAHMQSLAVLLLISDFQHKWLLAYNLHLESVDGFWPQLSHVHACRLSSGFLYYAPRLGCRPSPNAPACGWASVTVHGTLRL